MAQRGTWDAEESTITFAYADGENEDEPATLLMEANGHVLIRQSVLNAQNASNGEIASNDAAKAHRSAHVQAEKGAETQARATICHVPASYNSSAPAMFLLARVLGHNALPCSVTITVHALCS